MDVADVLVSIITMAALTVVFMFVLGAVVRRVLGAHIGIGRIALAGLLGFGAELGFESRFVWNSDEYNLALMPLQIGIIFLVALAFLVIAELVVPAGTIPRPDQWIPSLKRRAERTRRYAEVTRIALRRGLLPFRPNGAPTAAGIAERHRQAKALREALEDAGGAFVKLGQVMSTRSDVLPPEFLDELSHLQQRVPPADWPGIRSVLEQELKRPVEEVFSSFEQTPLAAASIGQVHRAVLVSGEAVAVKVQRPGIIPLIERDIDITLRISKSLERSADWAKEMGVAEIADGFSASLRQEIDYRVEASNMAAMSQAQQTHPADVRVGIPDHHASVSSSRVLVMQLVDGTTLSEPAALDGLTASARSAYARRLFRSVLTQIMDDGVFHTDLHPGNIMLTRDGELVLLDFGSVGRIDSELRQQITSVLLAFSRGDSRSFADALLEFVELPDDADEFQLRRQIGAFVSNRLGPGATIDVTVFTEMMQVLSANRLAVPGELTSAFRAIATLEGTLRHLDPRFRFLDEANEFAQERLAEIGTPAGVYATVKDEVSSILPILRRLPERADRISGALADGRLSVNVRLFADRRDRGLIRDLVNLLALTFLAGVFGIMSTLLLVSAGGPQVTPTLTLFQIFGYLLVVVSGLLTLKVLFDVFRLRR